jgi:hypothetical protein
MQYFETTLKELVIQNHLPATQFQEKYGGTTTILGNTKTNKSTQITVKVTQSSNPSGPTIENTLDLFLSNTFSIYIKSLQKNQQRGGINLLKKESEFQK